MNCNSILDLSCVAVETNSDEKKVLSLFPVEQDGQKMLDHMLLVSTEGRTYVVPNPAKCPEKSRERKRAERFGWNVDFRCGARF
mgnify:CR=1 FL=1